jgi:predicted cupin superfamily sugar epimerase
MAYPVDIQSLVERFQLEPHPEGGFFRETWRSSEIVPGAALPSRFGGARSIATAIYFLVGSGHFSAFHRIKSDETWHYYTGTSPLVVHMLIPGSGYRRILLGNRPEDGQVFQDTVPAGAWFASEPADADGYALVGCTVAPGFDFRDFEMAGAGQLVASFPDHEELIRRLCHC